MKIPLEDALKKVLHSLNVVSRRPIYEKYDKNVQGNTVWERGQTIVSVTSCFRDFPELDDAHSKIGVAIGTGGNTNYAKIDPGYAAQQAIAEAALKTAAVGGQWLGATDCLNFGNPEKSNQMGEFVAGVEGVKIACEALSIPIVSGNVSLYNESSGTSIPPSALVSVFARIDEIKKVPTLGLPKSGELFFIGKFDENLGGSEFLKTCDRQDARLPALSFEQIEAQADVMRQLVNQELVTMVNIVSTGGLWKAICESAFSTDHLINRSSDQLGFQLELPASISVPAGLFGESMGLLVATNDADRLESIAGDLATPVGKIISGNARVSYKGEPVWSGDLKSFQTKWEETLRSVV